MNDCTLCNVINNRFTDINAMCGDCIAEIKEQLRWRKWPEDVPNIGEMYEFSNGEFNIHGECIHLYYILVNQDIDNKKVIEDFPFFRPVILPDFRIVGQLPEEEEAEWAKMKADAVIRDFAKHGIPFSEKEKERIHKWSRWTKKEGENG